MLAAPAADALRRIAERANDVLAAYTPGAFPQRSDVAAPAAPAYSSDPLSVAAPPGAWFVTSAGGERTFTRDGTFHVAPDGALQTAGGAAVLGFSGDPGSSVPTDLRLPEPDHTLGRCTDLRLESDGTLAYTRAAIDPRTREQTVERAVVGRLALARFPAGGVPERIDANRYRTPAGVVPHLGTAEDGTFGPLATYARDSGSVDLNAGLAKLSEAYVAFMALAAAQNAGRAGERAALDLVK
jgi:flagellar basal body rod protein FlgG